MAWAEGVHRVNRLAVLHNGFDEPLEAFEHLDLRLVESRMRLALEEAGDLIRPMLDVVVVLHEYRRLVTDTRG